ncbi:MAG: hemolysin family protein [Balneolales bacterium]
MDTLTHSFHLAVLTFIEFVSKTADFYNGGFDFTQLFTLSILILLGLIFSALFSGSEVAFFSLSNNIEIESLPEDAKDAALYRVLNMLDHPRRLLATILIGNTFANIIAAVSAAVLTGTLAAHIGLPEILIFTIEVIVLTFAIVILSEITPKIMALNEPLKVSKYLSRFLYFFFVLLGPLARLISKSTTFLERKFPRPPESISSEDIKTMAEVGERHGSIHGDEREIIENVIEFGNTTVREIMTSRVNIVAVSTADSLSDMLHLIREKSVSRLPLYENELDNILGIIHSKDLLPYIDSNLGESSINWRTHARKALFVPTSKKIDDLLRDFQKERVHMAIVVDEYGGTEGLVTLDDVLEEIMGELSDENTEQVKLFTRSKSGVYIFDAKIDLDDMAEILQMELTTNMDEYETLGGLVYHLVERIPEVEEAVCFKSLELKVHEIENNRVTKVMVRILDEDEQNDKQNNK